MAGRDEDGEEFERRRKRKLALGEDEDELVEYEVKPRRNRKNPADDELPEAFYERGDLNRQLAAEPCNDLGNGNRFKERFGRDFMFVDKVGWFHWVKTHWDHGEGKWAAFNCALKISVAIWDERAAFKKSPGKRSREAVEAWMKRLAVHAEYSGQAHAVRSMLSVAEALLIKRMELLDADPKLCACGNGTIRLGKETTFGKSKREDSLTRKLGVKYVPGAKCPQFLKFLEKIMPDTDMRDFLQRILGYCLSGSTREQVIFLFHGAGNNGKSTLMNVVRHVMGDYAMTSPVQTFLAKREGNSGSDASPDLARLRGARLVTASEPSQGSRFDEGRIKEMTGGEPITARHLNQAFFSFKPNFTIVILLNNLPNVTGVDHGIWRRIRLVPFTVLIPDSDIDKDLDVKLIKEEAEGVLQWMIEGYEAYEHVELAPPESSRRLVEDYRADQDIVGLFLSECCERTTTNDPATGRPYECAAKDLREAFKQWCDDNALGEMMHIKTFGKKITSRGIRPRRSNGKTFYVGLVIKASAQIV